MLAGQASKLANLDISFIGVDTARWYYNSYKIIHKGCDGLQHTCFKSFPFLSKKRFYSYYHLNVEVLIYLSFYSFCVHYTMIIVI